MIGTVAVRSEQATLLFCRHQPFSKPNGVSNHGAAAQEFLDDDTGDFKSRGAATESSRCRTWGANQNLDSRGRW